MRMSIEDAHQIRDTLQELRGIADVAAIQDALWLRVILVEYGRRLEVAERVRFERRANGILSRLSAKFWL
jgi:hypothetical protein